MQKIDVRSTSDHALSTAGARTASPIIEMTTVPAEFTITPGRQWGDGSCVKDNLGILHGASTGVNVTVSVRRPANNKHHDNPATVASKAHRELVAHLTSVTTPLSGGMWLTSVDNYSAHMTDIEWHTAEVAVAREQYVEQFHDDVAVFGEVPAAFFAHAERIGPRRGHSPLAKHVANTLSRYYTGHVDRSVSTDAIEMLADAGANTAREFLRSVTDSTPTLTLCEFLALFPIALHEDAAEEFTRGAPLAARTLLAKIAATVPTIQESELPRSPVHGYGAAVVSCTPAARSQHIDVAAAAAQAYALYRGAAGDAGSKLDATHAVTVPTPRMPRNVYAPATREVCNRLVSVGAEQMTADSFAAAYADVMRVVSEHIRRTSTTLLFPHDVAPIPATLLCKANSRVPARGYTCDLSDVLRVKLLEPEISESAAASVVGSKLEATQRATVAAAKAAVRKKVSAMIASNADTLAGMVDPEKESLRLFTAVAVRLEGFAEAIAGGSMNAFDDQELYTLGKLCAQSISGFDPDLVKSDSAYREQLYAKAIELRDAAEALRDGGHISPEKVVEVSGVAEGGVDLDDLV